MADRHNFFELPHKPLRLIWMELLGRLGSIDARDLAAIDALEAETTRAVEIYIDHNEAENDWYGPRLATLEPELSAKWLAEHEDHHRVLEHLVARARAVRAEASRAARRELLADLYRIVCAFVADDLEHMSLEQGEIMFAFQAAYSDEQLRDIEAAFITERLTSTSVERLLPYFLRACNADERAHVLELAQQRVDAKAFDALMSGTVSKLLPSSELAELRARLGHQAA